MVREVVPEYNRVNRGALTTRRRGSPGGRHRHHKARHFVCKGRDPLVL